MSTSLVTLRVEASSVAYYITKYAAKPNEQLQNHVTAYALGLLSLSLSAKLLP